jgi:hypothetical protein
VLDNYLKEARVRFREVFTQFDRDRSGYLDSREFRALVQALLPRATEAQLAYFQVCLIVKLRDSSSGAGAGGDDDTDPIEELLTLLETRM